MPPVRTSFIPKRAAEQTVSGGGSSGAGIFFFLALIVFLGSVLLGGGAFAYKQYLTQSIKSKSDSLDRARAAFEPATIQDLMRLDKRMAQARQILEAHTSPSAVFAIISRSTLSTVAFQKYDFSSGVDGKGIIDLHGKTTTFSDVALQSDAMNGEHALKDVLFGGFSVAKDGGVEFEITASVDRSSINYRSNLLAGGGANIDTPNTNQVGNSGSSTPTQ